jgi:hypothetical protein
MPKYQIHEILQELASGKRIVTLNFPDTKPILAEITQVDLLAPEWKPLKVHILTPGLTITDTRWVEKEWVGEVMEEYQRPYKEDWVSLEYVTSIDFAEGQQLEIKL